MDSRVYFSRCGSYEKAEVESKVADILGWCGGPEALLKRGKRVLIKPNLLMARAPEGATTAHPAVVEAVARAFVQAGASVVIADSPGGVYNAKAMEKVYRLCGMQAAAEAAGARLNDDYSVKTVEFEKRSFNIITPAVEADVIVNIAKLKTHMLTYFTGAVKNMFGTVAGTHKAAMHAKYPYAETFSAALVDICRMRTPELSIIDGVEGMEGKGPSGGSVRKAGVLIASQNPFAADLAAMDFCGLDYKKSPVHRIGARKGLVPLRPQALVPQGDVVEKPEPFAEAVEKAALLIRMNAVAGSFLGLQKIKRRRMAYPAFSGRCVGCGDCVAVCPQKALELVDKRPALEKQKCIKCYCCHELCPIKAVEV